MALGSRWEEVMGIRSNLNYFWLPPKHTIMLIEFYFQTSSNWFTFHFDRGWGKTWKSGHKSLFEWMQIKFNLQSNKKIINQNWDEKTGHDMVTNHKGIRNQIKNDVCYQGWASGARECHTIYGSLYQIYYDLLGDTQHRATGHNMMWHTGQRGQRNKSLSHFYHKSTYSYTDAPLQSTSSKCIIQCHYFFYLLIKIMMLRKNT